MLLYLFLLSLGLVFGSFFSALSYRYLSNKKIHKGRSECDKCNSTISWYDNVPLLSYILLKGRCRNCKKKISLRYPLIELSTAIGFLIIGPSFIPLILFSLLLLIFIIDLEHQIIPDGLTFAGIIASLFMIQGPIFSHLFAGFFLALILLLLHFATRGRGMGLGDVKLAVFIGLLLGLKLGLIWLYISFLTGGIVAIILVLFSKKKLKDKIAFGPFLVVAVPLTLYLLK